MAQLLLLPATNYNFETASYHQNAEGYGLTRAGMMRFWNHYLARPADGEEPYASPLRAPDLSGLPSALIITAQWDPLRDDDARPLDTIDNRSIRRMGRSKQKRALRVHAVLFAL